MENKPSTALTDRHQFLKLKQEGDRVFGSRWLLFNFARNGVGELRLGVTVSRKIGSAVVRNRLKRWCREYFRTMGCELKACDLDVNVVFRPQTKEFYKGLSHTELDLVLDRAWKKTKAKAATKE